MTTPPLNGPPERGSPPSGEAVPGPAPSVSPGPWGGPARAQSPHPGHPYGTPPQPPPPRRTVSKLAVTALVLAVLDLLDALAQAERHVNYSDDVARGAGAWSFPLILAIVSVILAAFGLSTARKHVHKGKVPAIVALVLAGLTIIISVLHIAGLIVSSG